MTLKSIFFTLLFLPAMLVQAADTAAIHVVASVGPFYEITASDIKGIVLSYDKITRSVNVESYELATLSANSNVAMGYKVEIASTSNNFELVNSDAVPKKIPYTLNIQASSVTNPNAILPTDPVGRLTSDKKIISIPATDTPDDLIFSSAKFIFNVPNSISDFVFDDQFFEDTVTLRALAP